MNWFTYPNLSIRSGLHFGNDGGFLVRIDLCRILKASDLYADEWRCQRDYPGEVSIHAAQPAKTPKRMLLRATFAQQNKAPVI